MKVEKILTSIVVAALVAVFIGCSGSGETPVSQNLQLNSDNISNYPMVGVSDWDSSGEALEGMGAIGLFNLHIDPVITSVELTPLRESALTDVLEVVDITNFLTLTPCIDCVRIESIALDTDSNMILSIGIKHPFDAGNQSNPITALNRADLHVFNVEGIVISNVEAFDFPKTGEKIADFNLVNSDGYTGYLDKSFDMFYPTDATVHPYILHFDDYSRGNFSASNPMGFASVTTPPPSGNLVMAMGCDYDYQDYIFKLDKPSDFMFAVGCSFGISCTSKSKRFSPEYRVPQFNKKAASEISVEVISNNLVGALPYTTAEIEIRVVDISHKVLAAVALDKMRYESSVQTVYVDIPTINALLIAIPGTSSASGTGHDPSDPLIYTTIIKNSASGHEGTHWGLVKVVDSYPTGRNDFPPLEHKDGMSRVPPRTNPMDGIFTIDEFATYQAFTIDILSECGPITGSIIEPQCPITGIGSSQKIDFIVEAQTANGGESIVLYEVDFDYNGTTFAADASNTTGIFDDVGPFIVPEPCDDNIPYDFTVAFRAKDQCTPPNETIFATCNVTVESCIAPVGDVKLEVNRLTEDGNGINVARPWTLSWDAAGGAAEYAIYCDFDPSDGIDNDFQFVDAIPASSEPLAYDVPPEHITSANGWVKGNTYTVRNRAIEGDPLSELGNSEYAFVMTSCFDTLQISFPYGYPAGTGNTEGWKVALERTPYASSDSIYYWPYVTTSWRASDPAALSSLIYYLGTDWTNGTGGDSDYYPGHLIAETVETPSIPESSTRVLGFVATTTNGWDCHEEGGVIIGYCDSSTQPADGWDGTDFHWVKAYGSTKDFYPYNFEHSNPDYPFPFDMSDYKPGEKNSWKWQSG